MVVSEFSATLGYPKETRVGLNGDHLNIVKYGSGKETNFVTVATTLHQLVSDVVNEAPTEITASHP